MKSIAHPLLAASLVVLGCSSAPDSASDEKTAEVAEAFTDATTWQQDGSTCQRARVNGYETVLSRTTAPLLGQRWSVPGASPTSASVVGGRVYTGATNGTVRAVNALTGTTVWTRTLDDGVYYAPAMGYGRMFVTAGKTLYVLAATTGQILYRIEHTQNVGYSAPLLADGKVIVRDGTGTLFGYDPKAASAPSPLFSIEAAASADPSFGNGLLYVPTSSGRVSAYAMASCDGTCLRAWESGPLGGKSYAAPAVWPPRLLMTVYGDDGSLREQALDSTTGATLWTAPLAGATDATAPAVGYGRVYVGLLGSNELWAMSLIDGSLAWKAALAAEPSDAPAVANQVVYVPSGSVTGHLEAFRTSCGSGGASCTPIVDLPVDPFALAPSIAAGRVYVSGASSTVAFGLL